MSKRKIKLSNGSVHSYFSNGKNPCNCGSNLYHYETDGKQVYGVCNACQEDLYIIMNDESVDFEEWRYKQKI